MAWLFPSVIASFSSMLVITWIYFYLYKTERQICFGIWTISWLTYSLRFVCLFIAFQIGETAALLVGDQLFSLFSALLLCWGAYLWNGKPFPRFWWFSGALFSAWTVISVWVLLPFSMQSLPTFLFLGTVYIRTGTTFISHTRNKTVLQYITGWSLILWGVHKMGYPFLHSVVSFAPVGYLLDSFFTVVSAFGLVLIYFEKTKRDLEDSEENFYQLYKNAYEAIFVIQEGELVFLNPMTLKIIGYSSLAELPEKPFPEYIHPEDREMVLDRLLKRLKGEKPPSQYSFRIITREDDLRWVELNAIRIEWQGKPAILNFMNDKTEQKRAEEKFLKNQYYLTKAQEIGSIGTWELDIPKNILTWTDENYRIFGVSPGADLNYETFLKHVHPDDRDYVNEKWTASLNKEPYDIEHRLLVGKTVKWVAEKADIEFDEEGNPVSAIGFTQDITERKRSEEKIRESLLEKETLLQEIHHRVKNNMQVISSLLRLQADNTDNEQIKGILKDSQSRVHMMSIVHETLHGSEKLSEINLEIYLNKIMKAIFQTYTVDSSSIVLTKDVASIPICLDQAYPLGLIVNELMSNSLKYAFPDNREGQIAVNIQEKGDFFELVLSDNGIGMPAAFNLKSPGTLGLKLVKTLVESQLDGSINMESKNGTEYTISFIRSNTC